MATMEFHMKTQAYVTVAFLRYVLDGLHDDMVVVVPGHENGADRIREIGIRRMRERDGVQVYNGEFEDADESDDGPSEFVLLLGAERI